MAQGRQSGSCRHHKRIVLVDATLPKAEATVETAYQLKGPEWDSLAGAEETALVITAGALTSTPTFTVDTLQESRDGTTWRNVATISGVTINAAGETRYNLAAVHIMAPYVRILIGTVTLSDSAYFATLQVALECVVREP